MKNLAEKNRKLKWLDENKISDDEDCRVMSLQLITIGYITLMTLHCYNTLIVVCARVCVRVCVVESLFISDSCCLT